MWGQPIMAAVLSLLGTWIYFDPDEGAFVVYAGTMIAPWL